MASSTDKEITEAFNLFDRNGDGKISASELNDALRRAGQYLTENELMGLIKEYDRDANGSFNKKEFTEMMTKEQDQKELRKAFKTFDKNGDGSISKSELKEVMKAQGEKLSDKDIDEMIAAADTNKDGKVEFDEFMKMMTP